MEGLLFDGNVAGRHFAFVFCYLAEDFIDKCLVYSWCGKTAANSDNFFGYFLLYLFVLGIGQNLDYKRGNLLHFRGAEAPGGNGRCAQPDAAGYLRRPGV